MSLVGDDFKDELIYQKRGTTEMPRPGIEEMPGISCPSLCLRPWPLWPCVFPSELQLA